MYDKRFYSEKDSYFWHHKCTVFLENSGAFTEIYFQGQTFYRRFESSYKQAYKDRPYKGQESCKDVHVWNLEACTGIGVEAAKSKQPQGHRT